MGEREIEGIIDSLAVNEGFLKELFATINQYYKNIPLETEIVVESDRETITFEALPDFLNSKNLPTKIRKITITKIPVRKSDAKKTIQFYCELDIENKEVSHYILKGSDDGQLAVCKQQIENLLNRQKNWYYPIFDTSEEKEPDDRYRWWFSIIGFGATFSASVLTYRLLTMLSPAQFQEWIAIASIVTFFVVYHQYSKTIKELLPYVEITIKKPVRSQFWKGVAGVVLLSLIINLAWEGIKLIMHTQ